MKSIAIAAATILLLPSSDSCSAAKITLIYGSGSVATFEELLAIAVAPLLSPLARHNTDSDYDVQVFSTPTPDSGLRLRAFSFFDSDSRIQLRGFSFSTPTPDSDSEV